MGPERMRTKSYTYKTKVKWLSEKIGTLSSEGKINIEVSSPVEFKGKPGCWTPQDMFVASANACLMTSFLSIVHREGFSISDFESAAEGTLEMVDGEFIISKIQFFSKVTINDEKDKEKAHALVEKAKDNCLITKSMKTKCILNTEIIT